MIKLKKLNLLIKFFICILVNFSLVGQSLAKIGAMDAGVNNHQDKTIEKLFWLSGLNTRYQGVESALDWYKNIDAKALKSSQTGFAKNLMRHGNGPNLVRTSLNKTFLKGFDQGHADTSIEWFKSPTGRRILKAERESNAPDIKKVRDKFIKQMMITPPGESRLLVIERIISEEAISENIKSLFLAYVESMFPFNDMMQGKRLVKVVRMLEDERAEYIREQVRLHRLFDYRDIRETDLRAYARFLESPAGQWFSYSERQGFKKGTQLTLTNVHKVQRKLLVEIDEGGPEFPLLRELAPAGQRYLLVRLRDPFKPLFTDEGPVQTKEPEAVSRARQFGGELENIPPISLYVMNKIKKKRPALFRKMKHYERLFNNREDLKAMSDDEYADAIEGYRVVLEQASDTKVSKSPLQAEYENLKLTGVISKNTKTLALIETADRKGHVVDEGDIIGPRFGHVEDVQPERIIVIEKSRDYLGNILTRERTIEFSEKI